MASSLNANHPWFEICHPRPTAKYQVFIFPSAGSASPSYREWDKNLREYEFSIIIYPGRGPRFDEKLITDVKEYVNQLDKGLLPYITKPCIFIGHSLGTVISFALAKHMIDKKKKANLIQLMVEMGRGPPHLKDPDVPFSQMTDKQIANHLKELADPATRQIFEYPDYINMILPMLKADSRVGEQLLEETQLDIPIIVYGGEKEKNVDEPFLNRWKELTTKEDLFRVTMFPGHHNFQSECQTQVLQTLKEDFKSFSQK